MAIDDEFQQYDRVVRVLHQLTSGAVSLCALVNGELHHDDDAGEEMVLVLESFRDVLRQEIVGDR